MKAERIFIFLFIVASLIAAVFLIKKELLPSIVEENPLLQEKLASIEQGYSGLKEIIDVKDSYTTDAPGFIASFQQEFLLKELLTAEQKIGQLFIVGLEGTAVTLETEELMKKFCPGGVLLLKRNIESPEQMIKFTAALQKLSLENTGLPLFIAVDQEGGLVSRVEFLSEKTPQSEIKSVEQAYQIGLKRGEELKNLGVNLNLAPLLDEAKKGDFIFDRTFQESGSKAGQLAKALIKGQKQAGIFSAVKHFPGYGGIPFNPEEKLAATQEVPENFQFQEAVSAAPEMVMTSNVIYQELDPELPLTFSSTSIQFLKENLGEPSLIISDDLSQNSLLNKFSLEEIVALPVNAGVDMLIFSGWRSPVAPAIKALQRAAETGQISEQKINRSVLRIIELKSGLIF